MSDSVASLVSVIVPCYNDARYIAEALDSAFGQLHAQIEVIAVDDGSTDNTAEILVGYPAVRLVRQDNAGVAAARNAGLAVATGEFVVFLDQDDRLHLRAISTALQAFERHPEAAMVYGFPLLVDAVGASLMTTVPPPVNGDCYASLLSGKVIVAPPSSAMFRRDVVEILGRFDPALRGTDDYDLYLRLARDHVVHCHGAVVCDYRIHGLNASSGHIQMRAATIAALDRQREHALTRLDYAQAYRAGRRHWRDYWGAAIGKDVLVLARRRHWRSATVSLTAVVRHPPGPRAFLTYASRLRPRRGLR